MNNKKKKLDKKMVKRSIRVFCRIIVIAIAMVISVNIMMEFMQGRLNKNYKMWEEEEIEYLTQYFEKQGYDLRGTRGESIPPYLDFIEMQYVGHLLVSQDIDNPKRVYAFPFGSKYVAKRVWNKMSREEKKGHILISTSIFVRPRNRNDIRYETLEMLEVLEEAEKYFEENKRKK